MQAMILAAGLGTRLLPLTAYIPKPLFPVRNIPSLRRIISQLEEAGIRHIIINCCHLSDMILEALSVWKSPARIIPLREPSLLGTGGALRNALPYVKEDEPLLVVNGDVVTDIDFAALLSVHKNGCAAAATLAVHFREPWNMVRVRHGRITGFGYRGGEALAFTGISVLDPAFIKTIPSTPSCLIDAFRAWIEKGNGIRALRIDRLRRDYLWEDIGSPAGYLSAHGMLAAKKGTKLVKGEGTEPPHDFSFERWAVIGKDVSIGHRVSLKRTVVWDGCRIPAGSVLADSIVTPYGIYGAEG